MTDGCNDDTQGFSASSYDIDLAIDDAVGRKERWSDEVQSDLATYSAWEVRVKERSQELQLNHALLQQQAVAAKELAMRGERDALLLRLAEVEQDKLLLESKLRDVVSFENGLSLDPQQQGGTAPKKQLSTLKAIRGKLLDAANAKIGELSDALHRSSAETASERQQWAQVVAERDAVVAALREETARLSQQLAYRTVLFSAQERRWRESMRSQMSLQSERDHDLLTTRARLQQLESVYERTDRERVERHLRGAQLQAEVQGLQAQLADESDRAAALDVEVSEAVRLNTALQATVERLRGSDVVDLERELALELEDMRRSARETEAQLSRQLEEARDRLAQEADARGLLMEELQRLREIVEYNSQTQSQYQDYNQQNDNEQGYNSQQYGSQHDEQVDANRFGYSSAEDDGVREADISWTRDCPDPDLDSDRGHGSVSYGAEVDDQVVFGDADDALQPFEAQAFVEGGAGAAAGAAGADGAGYPHDATVIGHYDVAESTATVLPDLANAAVHQQPTGYPLRHRQYEEDENENENENENADSEVQYLRSEVARLSAREGELERVLGVQKAKLALVLRRAAMLSPLPTTTPPTATAAEADAAVAASTEATVHQLRLALEEKEKQVASHREHIEVLAQQVGGYRAEVAVLETQYEQSKEVGVLLGATQGAEREERLRLVVEDLTSRIAELSAQPGPRPQEDCQGNEASHESATVVPSTPLTQTQTTSSSAVQTDDLTSSSPEAEHDEDAVVNAENAHLWETMQRMEARHAELSLAHQGDADALSRATAEADELRARLSDLELQSHRHQQEAALALSTAIATEEALVEGRRRAEEAEGDRQRLLIDHAAETDALRARIEELAASKLDDQNSNVDTVDSVVAAEAAEAAEAAAQREASLLADTEALHSEVARLSSALAAAVTASQEVSQHSTLIADQHNKQLAQAAAAHREALEASSKQQEQWALLSAEHQAVGAERDGLRAQLLVLEEQSRVALEEAHRLHKSEMKHARRRISARCKALVDRQKAQFTAEREQTLSLVRQECAEIVAEAQVMLQDRSRSRCRHRDDNEARGRHDYGRHGFSPASPYNDSDGDPSDPMAATVVSVSDAGSSPDAGPLARNELLLSMPMTPKVAFDLVKRALAQSQQGTSIDN